MKKEQFIKSLVIANLLGLLAPENVFPTAYTWIHNAATANTWNLSTNWTPAGFPNAIADSGTFGNVITANRTITLGQTITINALNIDNANNLIFSGNNFIFQASSGNAQINITNANGNGAHTISSPSLLNSPLVFSQGSTGLATFSGVISGGNNFTKTGTGTLTIPNTTTNTMTGSYIISQGALRFNSINNIVNSSGVNLNGGILEMGASLTGTVPITLSAPSTIRYLANMTLSLPIGGPSSVTFTPMTSGNVLILSGANTYAGGTTLSGGATVSIATDGNLGQSGTSLTIDSTGGRLNATANITTTRPIILNGNGTFSAGGGILEFDGPISGPGMFIQAATGTLYLNNQTVTPNSYTGGTSIGGVASSMFKVRDGTQLGSGTVSFLNNSNFTIDPGSTPLPFSTTMANNISVTGANISWNIPNNVTLNLSGQISGNSTIVVNSAVVPSGTLILSGINTFSGTLNIRNTTNLQIATGQNLGNASLLFDNSAFLTITGSSTINNQFILHAQPVSIVANPGTSTNLAGQIVFSGGTMARLQISGGGTIALTNVNNTYQGGTVVIGSTLQVPDDRVLGFRVVPGDSAVTLLNNSIFEVTASPFSSARTFNIANDETFKIDTGTTLLTGIIQDIGIPGNLIKAGPGSLALAGANIYTGTTTINNGSLLLQGVGSIASSSSLTLAATGTVFDISGLGVSSATINTLNGVSGSTINLGAAGLVINQNTAGTFAGVIQGSGSLTVNGPSPLKLTNVNTYTGQTTIASQGELIVNGSIGSSSLINVLSGSTLSGNGIVSNVVNSGKVTLGTSNTIGTLTGISYEFNAGSEYDVKILGTQSDLITASGAITINPGSTLRVLPQSSPTTNLYLIAHADSGITGSFSNFLFPSSRYIYSTIQDFNNLYLTVKITPVSPVLPSGNLQNIAFCFDEMESLGLVDDTIFDIFNTMSDASLIAAFEQLDPSIFNTLSITEENIAGSFFNLFSNHTLSVRHEMSMDQSDPASFVLWATPFYQKTDQNNLGFSTALTGYNNRDEGILTGLDYRLTEQLFLTAAFGYANTQLKANNYLTQGWLNSYGVFAGAAWSSPRLLIDTCFAYLFNDVRTKRTFQFESELSSGTELEYHAFSRSRNHANTYAITGEAAYDLIVIPHENTLFTVWPYLDLQYIYVRQNRFEESGSNLSMVVLDKSSDLLKTNFGMGCSFIHQNEFYDFFFDLSLGYRNETRFLGKASQGQFANLQSCTFDVVGLSPQNNLFAPSAKIGIKSTAYPFFLIFSYNGGYGTKFNETQLAIEINQPF